MSDMYETIHDFIDDEGDEDRNILSYFEGSWTEIQEHIRKMKLRGCYNIQAILMEECKLDLMHKVIIIATGNEALFDDEEVEE